MKTPFGQNCPYFYSDYYRGRSVEDCRLLNLPGKLKVWDLKLCEKCPVPSIKLANNCKFMTLSGEIKKGLFSKRVKVTAYCIKTHQIVKEPKIGCGKCHEADFIEDMLK